MDDEERRGAQNVTNVTGWRRKPQRKEEQGGAGRRSRKEEREGGDKRQGRTFARGEENQCRLGERPMILVGWVSDGKW